MSSRPRGTPSYPGDLLRLGDEEGCRAYVLRELREAGGNVSRAARRMDVSRMELYRLLRRCGLGPELVAIRSGAALDG